MGLAESGVVSPLTHNGAVPSYGIGHTEIPGYTKSFGYTETYSMYYQEME